MDVIYMLSVLILMAVMSGFMKVNYISIQIGLLLLRYLSFWLYVIWYVQYICTT